MKLIDYINKFPGHAKSRFRKQLAKELEVTPEAIRNWEKGKRMPKKVHALKLEKITDGKVKSYELRPDLFMGGESSLA